MYITFHRVYTSQFGQMLDVGVTVPVAALHGHDTHPHPLSFHSAHLTHLTHHIPPFKNPQLHLLRHTCYIVRRYFLNSPSCLRYCQLNSGCNVPQRMDSTLHFSANPIPTLPSSNSLYRIPNLSHLFKLSIRLRVISKKGIHPMEFRSQSVT
jgi:hypothetical protein